MQRILAKQSEICRTYKIQAIKDMNPPSNVSDVRRFLGIVNQLSKISGRLALLTEPLGELLRKKY